VNPLIAVMRIIGVAAVPTLTIIDGGLETIEKSWTLTLKVVVRMIPLLFPVIVAV
jgi:hypothetical protein